MCSGVTTIMGVVSAVLSELEAARGSLGGSDASPASESAIGTPIESRSVVHFLSPLSLLLVLDNCEDVIHELPAAFRCECTCVLLLGSSVSDWQLY